MPKFHLLPTLAALVALLAAPGPSPHAETLVVANKGEATVSLIDLKSGAVAATLPTGEGPHEVATSLDGARAVITDYGNREAGPGSSLTLIDIAGATVLKTVDLGEYTRPHGIAWLDAERLAVTAEGQKALLVVNMESGTVERAIQTGQEISHMLALSTDKRRAFIANIGSGSLTVIDLVKGEKVADIKTGDGAEGVAVTGDQVWVSNRAADTITVLDAGSLEVKKDFASAGFPIRAVATPDGAGVLVTHARAGDLAIYDPAKLGEGRRVELGISMKDVENRLFGDRFGDSSVPIGVAVDAASSRAWVAHANADILTEHKLPSGDMVRRLEAGREPDGMAFSPVTVRVKKPETP
ncbi:MAG: YncE family protein [Acidobacteriota bacterium]